MAQPQNNISLVAPGFYGLNTQDSPLGQDIKFASIADNCVIDKFGRIAVRKGFQVLTSNPDVLGGNPIVQIDEFLTNDSTSYLFACGNNAIYIQQQVAPFELVVLTTPNAITADNWQIIPFNNKCYFVQKDHAPLVFDPLVSTTGLAEWAENPGWPDTGTDYPNCGTAAFGRLWVGGFQTAVGTVFWSGLLDGENWTTDTGFVETEKYWPSGYDKVTAIAGHNNQLVIFGQRSILLYDTTADVANTFKLRDTIEGIGCIARDSVVPEGEDLMYVDATGVRTLNRTIQERSVPIGDLSINVRSDFKFALTQEPSDDVKAVYHPEDSFYCVFLPSNPKTYVFDTRFFLENGSSRTTQWVNVTPRCGTRLDNRTTYFAGVGGVYEYKNTSDIAYVNDVLTEGPIKFSYFTHPMDFGAPANTMFPKQVDATFIGGQAAEVCLEWFYDYKDYEGYGLCQTTDAGLSVLWNTDAEWGEDSFFTKGQQINQLRYNIWGSGKNIKIGFNVTVLGSPFSIQELNIQALQGRTL